MQKKKQDNLIINGKNVKKRYFYWSTAALADIDGLLMISPN
jgi:hypothetical protein